VVSEPAGILGDARQLRSAFDNLLSNACRHALNDVQVTMKVSNDVCEIAIHDDGSGLGPDDCERVFERFVRLDEARDRDEGGSGLGLAIVAAIASSVNGSVSAEPGPGGHFFFTFPALSSNDHPIQFTPPLRGN
jgi:signal transduction histidine kinase